MTKLFGSQTFAAMPVAGFAALALSLIAGATPMAAQDGQKGQIHIQKVCPNFTGDPGSYCTVTVSDLAAIPVQTTRVYYGQPGIQPEGAGGFLDSPIILYIGPGNWASGRCTVDATTGLGLCRLSDGTGPLAGFSARLNVRIDLMAGITYWDGTYSFNPLPDR